MHTSDPRNSISAAFDLPVQLIGQILYLSMSR